MELANKLALITGGSGGIGQHIAADLLACGARVVLASDNPDRLGRVASTLSTLANPVHWVECDVGQAESVGRLCSTVLDKYGCPDILINCAGFATYRTFEASNLSEIERLVNVNLLGPMRCTSTLLPYFIERRGGVVVNMASIAGRMIITPNGTYCASKHGLVAWSEVLKYELQRFDIQVNVICPGRVETNFFNHETFRTRASRLETRWTTSVEAVSRATLEAIRTGRFMSYVPAHLGAIVWLTNTLPWLVKPVYGKLLNERIGELYSSMMMNRTDN